MTTLQVRTADRCFVEVLLLDEVVLPREPQQLPTFAFPPLPRSGAPSRGGDLCYSLCMLRL